MAEKTFDECYWFDYDSYQDIRLYEVGSFRCPPSYGYGPIIRNTHILHYIAAGKGKLQYGGKEYSISAKQIFVIPEGAVSYYEADQKEPWEYLWIRFHGPISDVLLQKAGITTDAPVFSTGRCSEAVEGLLRHLLRCYMQEYDAIGTVYKLFQQLIEASLPEPCKDAPERTAVYVQKVLNYIHQKYAEPISIREISHYCSLNRSYLSRIFQASTGVSPQQYLQNYRIKKAKQLLLEGRQSIQTVAYSVGYNDPFAFSKAFKRLTGQSPSAYRSHFVEER